MTTTATVNSATGPGRSHRLRQWIKLVVYTLLLVNFGFYIADDIEIASHTIHDGWTLLDWTSAFATSLDEAAWFILLFMFELETYLLSDAAFTRTRVALMHGTRIICYLFLAHTVFAYSDAGRDLLAVSAEPGVSELCQLADRELSFGSNLVYTELDGENCGTLSADSQFYLIEEGTVVTDTRGLQIERELVWIDVAEAIVWLLILFLIELLVRLQDRGITSGGLHRLATTGKIGLYCLLWAAAAYWAWRGHWMFAWDEALWILGFMAIGMNISEWREEIEQETPAAG